MKASFLHTLRVYSYSAVLVFLFLQVAIEVLQSAPPYCGCRGKLISIDLVYNGEDGATLEIYDEREQNRYPIATFSHVQNGEMLTIRGWEDGKLDSDIFIKMVGLPSGQLVKVKTTCRSVYYDKIFGPYSVLGYADEEGSQCIWDKVPINDTSSMNAYETTGKKSFPNRH